MRKVEKRMQKKVRFTAAVLSAALLAGPFVATPVALAEDVNAVVTMEEPVVVSAPKVSLEEAILKVKEYFTVSEDYTDFSSSYNTYNNRQAWSLHWSGSNGTGGSFSAEVNALNGDILSMNHWSNEGQTNTEEILPALTKEEAQKVSDELLSKLLGKRAGDLELISNAQVLEHLDYGRGNYVFQYQRLLNGVPFIDNGADVQVSKVDGRIASYSLNWSETQAPDAEGVIEVSQAEKAFAAAPFFKLIYWQPSIYRILAVGEKQEPKLVYQLTGENQGAIDAFTGEPLQLGEGTYLTMNQARGGMGQATSEAAADAVIKQLTPQEREEVELTEQLLNQEEAAEIVKKWVGIPANLTLQSVYLGTSWNDTLERHWSLEWGSSGTEVQEGEAEYLSAVVNASSGALTSFHTYYRSAGNTEESLDQAAAQKLAEEFLQKIQPEKFGQVTLVPEETTTIAKAYMEPWATKYFSYQRVANGVEFPDNGLYVSVDPVAGQVASYSFNWTESELPSTTDILSKEQGAVSFLEARPMTLAYVQTSVNGMLGEPRLVYIPWNQNNSTQTSNILDAKNGELLDYQGQPLKDGPRPYIFSDLAGVEDGEKIAALGKAGLFGDFGDLFKPEEKVTSVSLLRAMYLNMYDYSRETDLTDAEIMSKAQELGWVKEEIQPQDPVSRETLAKVLVRYMGLTKFAELKDIYQLSIEDAAQITPDALGYVALAKGTGIIKIKSGENILAPQEEVSRAEAAISFYKVLGWLNAGFGY